jgi:glycosyltransferase involved in cell wall biosynthesis
MSTCIVVVPCYNEAARLDTSAFRRFATANDAVNILFVDDGSRDNTASTLETLCQSIPERFSILALGANSGKAEAVRRGLLKACEMNPTYVGFWDADLATPLDDIVRFTALLDARSEIEMVFGSRVHLLGRSVRRKLARHYLGRVFATLAAFALGVGIYDTQCGAKIFRASESFKERLREPFIGGWIFDVEIIAREIEARRGTGLPPVSNIIYEHPLEVWNDVAGSKIKLRDWFKVGISLVRIYFKHLVGRRQSR